MRGVVSRRKCLSWLGERRGETERGLRRNLFRVFGRTFYFIFWWGKLGFSDEVGDGEGRCLEEKDLVCQSRPELLEFGNVMKGEWFVVEDDDCENIEMLKMFVRSLGSVARLGGCTPYGFQCHAKNATNQAQYFLLLVSCEKSTLRSK